MAITAVCTGCGKSLRVKDELKGKTIKCPGCKKAFVAGPTAAPLPTKRTRASTLGEKRDASAPKFSINPKVVLLAILILAIPTIVLGWKLGPGAVNAQWQAQAGEAYDEVESVVDHLLKAHTSNEGSYNPNKPVAVPRMTELMFIFPPFEFSMPESVEFKGTSTEGEFKGRYHPATREMDIDLEVGGTGLSTGVVVKKGTKVLKCTGRMKDGQVSAEIGGKKAEIYYPPKTEE